MYSLGMSTSPLQFQVSLYSFVFERFQDVWTHALSKEHAVEKSIAILIDCDPVLEIAEWQVVEVRLID